MSDIYAELKQMVKAGRQSLAPVLAFMTDDPENVQARQRATKIANTMINYEEVITDLSARLDHYQSIFDQFHPKIVEDIRLKINSYETAVSASLAFGTSWFQRQPFSEEKLRLTAQVLLDVTRPWLHNGNLFWQKIVDGDLSMLED